MPATMRLSLLALVLLAACSKPKPPDKDQPPEPQAAARHAAMSEAIRRPIEQAKAVETQVVDAADRQQAAIDAQAD